MEFIQSVMALDWKAIGEGLLMVLGGFSILAKITPWEWDNKVLDSVQKLINKLGLAKGK